jgi:hypothetical protein
LTPTTQSSRQQKRSQIQQVSIKAQQGITWETRESSGNKRCAYCLAAKTSRGSATTTWSPPCVGAPDRLWIEFEVLGLVQLEGEVTEASDLIAELARN